MDHAWLIVCIGQAVLAKFAELYFHNALMAGTPFTQVGARELRRLGILTMVIPTGCAVVAEVVQGILTGFMNVSVDGWMEFNFDNESSVVVGVMFIVGFFVWLWCRNARFQKAVTGIMGRYDLV